MSPVRAALRHRDPDVRPVDGGRPGPLPAAGRRRAAGTDRAGAGWWGWRVVSGPHAVDPLLVDLAAGRGRAAAGVDVVAPPAISVGRRCGPSWPSPPAAWCSCPGSRRSCTRRPTPAPRGPASQRPTNMLGATIQDFGGGAFKDAIAGGRGHGGAGPAGPVRRAAGRHGIDLDLRTRRRFRYEGAVVGLTLGLGATVSLVTATTYATRYAAVIYPAGGAADRGRAGLLRVPRVLPGRWPPSWPCACWGPTGTSPSPDPGSRGGPGHQQGGQARRPRGLLPRPAGSGLQPLARSHLGLDEVVYPTLRLAAAGRLGRLRRAQRGRRPAALATRLLARAGSTASSWSGRARTAPSKASARRCSALGPGPARVDHRGRGRGQVLRAGLGDVFPTACGL